MIRRVLSMFVLTGIVLLMFTSNAYANIGLPMIFLGVPFLILAFIPIFAIEMLVYHKDLKIPWKRCAAGSFWANVLTTIVGYPISWILHVAVGMAVGYPIGFLFSKFHNIDWLGYALFPLISAWLMPGVDQWMIYLAGIFGLIPAFWISVKIEGKLLQKLFKGQDSTGVKKVVWKANRATYLLLAAFLGIMSLYHGLIKLHAFDLLRNRSDERVTFSSKLEGDILVSSDSEIYLFNLHEGKNKRILSRDLKNIYGKRFENMAMGEKLAWLTLVDFSKCRQEKLYRYDLVHNTLTEIAAWRNINKVVPVNDGAFVFSGESYISRTNNQKEDGIYKVSNDGHTKKVFDTGLHGANKAGVISPAGDKIAIIKMTDSKNLNIMHTGPFLVQAELSVYNFDSKETAEITNLWGIFQYKNIDNFHISWHPSKDIVYFSNTEFSGSSEDFLRRIHLNELKQQYGTGDVVFDSEAMESLLNEMSMVAKTKIYGYSFQTKETEKFTNGIGLLGWSPNGDFVIVEKSQSTFELFNPETEKVYILNLDHLKEGRILQLTWSKDGKFIAYLGDSEHFLDKHHYNEGMYWRNAPGWIWIKELATGKERKLDVKPINPAFNIFWH